MTHASKQASKQGRKEGRKGGRKEGRGEEGRGEEGKETNRERKKDLTTCTKKERNENETNMRNERSI